MAQDPAGNEKSFSKTEPGRSAAQSILWWIIAGAVTRFKALWVDAGREDCLHRIYGKA
jgi:hypothetical protein